MTRSCHRLVGAVGLASVVTLSMLGACSGPEEDAGRALYMKECAVCHGADGTGNGPAASRLRVAPPDLTRIDAREDGAFPWAHVMSQIDGFTRRNRPDQVMPEFGATMDSPTVLVDTGDGILTPTPEPLVDLAVYLESLQQ